MNNLKNIAVFRFSYRDADSFGIRRFVFSLVRFLLVVTKKLFYSSKNAQELRCIGTDFQNGNDNDLAVTNVKLEPTIQFQIF